MVRAIWIETDEHTEVAKALEMLEKMLDQARDDPYYWKWAIIALHNALQEAIVCSISGSAGLGALKPDIAAEWLRVYRAGTGDYPASKLDWFPNLYRKMKGQLSYSPPQHVDESVERLNTFRNEFLHFIPQGWSIMVNGLPDMTADCLSVVDHLLLNNQHFTWHDESEGERARVHYRRCLDLVERHRRVYLEEMGRGTTPKDVS